MTTHTATAQTPVKIGAKQWRTLCCWGCGTELTSARKPPAMVGCSQPACDEAHNLAVSARHDEADKRRAVTRAANAELRAATPAVTGDWQAIIAISRGRRVRP
jgi:hypothetical protein